MTELIMAHQGPKNDSLVGDLFVGEETGTYYIGVDAGFIALHDSEDGKIKAGSLQKEGHFQRLAIGFEIGLRQVRV